MLMGIYYTDEVVKLFCFCKQFHYLVSVFRVCVKFVESIFTVSVMAL